MRLQAPLQIVRELASFAVASGSLQSGAEDDDTMAESVEEVAERLAQLETTVANGFHEMELRFSALDRKIDVDVEALRSDIWTVAETITAVTAEMRRTTDSIRQEQAADREVLRLSLLNHAGRIHELERFNSNR